jgi:hypothetical protein
MNKYMIATKAIHMLGDISRKEEDLCIISKEDEENYIGMWVTGFGFFDVKFPKETTRELTQEEVNKYNETYVQINNQVPVKLNVE